MSTSLSDAILATLSKSTASIENVDPDDDVPQSPRHAELLLTTATKSTGENESDDDDESALRAMTTTLTDSRGENESDDDGDSALRAMTTTLTESNGDNENDPDSCEAAYETRSSGFLRPLLYRFAETPEWSAPKLEYDPSKQLHVLRDGRIAIDAIQAETST